MTENEKFDLILAKLDKIDRLEERFSEFEERLDRLENRFDGLEERLDRLENRLDRLESEFGEFREKLDKLDSDVTGLKLILENEVRTNIMRVAEGHLDLYRKLREATKADEEKEMIAVRVNIMEMELRTIKERLDRIA